MPTRNDYEKLILHSLPPGAVVRVPMTNSKQYASQRMMFYRTLKTCIKLGKDITNISSVKVEENGKIFLEIQNQIPGSTAFLFKEENGEFKEKVIDSPDEPLLTAEELKFQEWLKEAGVDTEDTTK